MAVTIGRNTIALSAQRQLLAATEKVLSAAERLSSGQRINKASDDAAGLSIATKLKVDTKIFTQAIRNVNDSLSLTAISSAALSQLSSITTRQLELAEQSANGVYSSKQREALSNEGRALTNEYNRIIATTKFNGISVLANPWQELQTQAGSGAGSVLSSTFADALSTKVTPGSYFTLDGASTKAYVWFTVDGQGTNPQAGDTGIQVNLYTYSTPGTPVAATPGVTDVTFTDGGNTFDGDNFYIWSATAGYYVWFNVDGGGYDPNDPDGQGVSGIEVYIDSSWNEDQVATATAAQLAATGEFAVTNTGYGQRRFTNTVNGAVGSSSYTFQGATYAEQYSQGNNAYVVGAVTKNIEGTQIRDAVRTALTSSGRFSSVVAADGSLIVTDTTAGRIVNASEGNSGIVLVDPVYNGTGRSSYTMGAFSSDLQLGDFNGDGILDAVTADALSASFSVRLGQGDGSFGVRRAYSNSGSIYNMQIGDINNDGKLDLFGLGASASISILLGNGDGSFRSNTPLALGVTGQHAVRATDMNGDGNLDIVATTTSGVTIRLGNGNNTFLSPTSYAMGVNPYHGMEVGDVNNDGKMDVLVVNANVSGTVSVRLGNGDGTLRAATSYEVGNGPNWLALGDVNGDGKLDFAATNSTGNTVTVSLGNGDGSFSSGTNLVTGNGPRNVLLKDVNRDGLADLLYSSPGSSYASVRFASGGGAFGSATNFSNGSFTSGLAVGDLNNDGVEDLVTSDYSSNTLSTRMATSPGVYENTNTAGVMRLIFGHGQGMTQINHIDLTTAKGARTALTALGARLDRINAQIGVFGSNESRLLVAQSNLASARENYLAAESRIKDADIASESASFVRATILQKVGSGILAQANQAPKIALSLLEQAGIRG